MKHQFRVWDKMEKRYLPKSDCYVSGIGSVSYRAGFDYQFYTDKDVIVEFYTGVVDRENQYIYEGDTVKYDNDNWTVIWDDEECRFRLRNELFEYQPLKITYREQYLVTGNIHENDTVQLKTLPLRFRVWSETQKQFVLLNADMDDYVLWQNSHPDTTFTSVSQAVGLRDTAHREIYTGDILEVKDNNCNAYQGIVEIDNGCIGLRIANPKSALTSWVETSEWVHVTIVGNIWTDREKAEALYNA